MAGILLCAFFVLGVMTGFSEPGRRVATRAKNLLAAWTDRTLAKLGPFRHAADSFDQSIAPVEVMLHLKQPAPKIVAPDAVEISRGHNSEDPIAIVERRDGFYALLAGGEIRGPVSPNQQPDLPIMSGPRAESALPSDLLNDAAQLVRAEAQMANMVSEMRVDSDGSAAFFLDRERMAIVVDLDQAAVEIRRALEVLKQWEGRERLIAMLDMTVAGMAVVRLKADLPRIEKRAKSLARIRDRDEAARISIAARGH